jgi:hypothetical protein
MVPSASMGRDIKVQFRGGGTHAVYLPTAYAHKTITTVGDITPPRLNGSTSRGCRS